VTKERKTFILDTSVLLYDKKSISSFPDCDVVIPLTVLDELDRFKEKPGLLGENARYVNRFLDDLRQMGNLNDGIHLEENNQEIKVEINYSTMVPSGLNPSHGDNRIISVANEYSKSKDSSVTVVTKDINFRVKCDALGILSEDYYKDRIVSSENQIYTGQCEIFTDKNTVNRLFEGEKINISDLDDDFNIYPNQYVVIKSENSSFLGCARDGEISPLVSESWKTVSINPKNKEQKFALDLLMRDDIPLVTMTGIAGSGKTFLTLMSALEGLHNGKYERIVVTRSLQTVGKDIGYLPGSVKEKMDPWIGPIVDNIRHTFKDVTYFEIMREKGQIEIAPLAFMRGRTFNDTFIIVDEAQNSTIHELKTIITRVGENSKIVLLGDIDQIDTPYIDTLSNGLTIVVQKLKGENLTGHITLLKGERSKLATLASRVI